MARTLTSSPTKRSDLVVFLGALCMFLSAIEYMMPKPTPFLRVGIANLPILISLELLPIPFLLLVVMLKVIGQGLVVGTLFSYVLLSSLAGSLTSVLAMLLTRRLFGLRVCSYSEKAPGSSPRHSSLWRRSPRPFLARLPSGSPHVPPGCRKPGEPDDD